MRHFVIFVVALSLLTPLNGFAQQQSYSFTIEQQEDPAYMLYKTAYNLVLQSNWKDAQKKFEQVMKFYPKSSYRDDASYWYAYCLKYQDQKKAVEALKKYLTEFPKSRYRSDALEDLAELQARYQRNLFVLQDSVRRDQESLRRHQDSLRRHQDSLRRHRVQVNVPEFTVDVPAPDVHFYEDWDFPFRDQLVVSIFTDEMQDEMEWGLYQPWFPSRASKDVDENTRLKISALRGITADRDSESFRTVKDILLDRSENPRLREEALRLFSRYEEFETLPTLKGIAKSDPERRLRHGAIYYIGKHERDKDGAAGTLIELYTSTPKDSARLKERLLYSIAKTRTEKGMDFLVSIANSSEDYKIRESTLYWLGKYGEGKKKKALYEILKRK